MAKRQSKQKDKIKAFENRRRLWLKIGWTLVVALCVLFGYSYGSPLVIEGQVIKGILIGLAYGGGALAAILISFFLNRKLKGF